MKILKLKAVTFSLFLATASMLFAGCSAYTKTEKGAAIGVAGGGLLGALVGHAAGNTAIGALVGGAVGGTAGGLIGHKMDKQAAEIKQTVPGASVSREGEGILVKFDSGILFDVDKTNLKPGAQTSLQQLSQSLKNNPQTNILVVGHTDSTGTAAHNMDLSIRRSVAVKSFLVQQGVNGSRLTTQGKGETEPIAPNSTLDGRAQNRRVEIVIVANDQMKQQAAQGQ
ncbi:OmpA family protein [Mucilaginibacter sp. BJC16-A38]|uniref:OmpA family protein n=1 Tax=Mucilaginibacter phenanthrenivorans TaxID=1234842 RepID=UPI0021587E35|nr:OmpA family protein [Mucilaginibacter phenanthrenivorans]MCR8558339.1 OmpA family protein [Mucilaginibacter phenanthrenivorans]